MFQQTEHDTDNNNIYEHKTYKTDTTGDGLLNQESNRHYNNQSGLLENANVARDVNGDGIMDIALEKTFDQTGNETSFTTTYAENGLYGSGDEKPTWEALFGKDDLEAVSSSDELNYNPFELLLGSLQRPQPSGIENAVNNPTAAAQFISESAGYDNTLFTYDVDDQGQISNIRQILENANQASVGAALGDVSLTDGQPNLLLLPDGANLVDANSELIVVNGQLQINGQTHTGDAYFSHSAEMSTDGKQHFQLSKDENGHSLVNIEDLHNLGDQDFNDLEIKVLIGQNPRLVAGLSPKRDTTPINNFRVPDLLL